jgi:hypothetical protein
MTKHWNYNEARDLKAQGMGWNEIGRIFGISATVAHMRTDPIYAAKRREQINANRRMASYALGKRDHVHHVVPEPAKDEEIGTGPFITASGIVAYRQWVPNRTALGSAPLTAKGEGGYVSLPFVSILASRTALETKEGRGS